VTGWGSVDVSAGTWQNVVQVGIQKMQADEEQQAFTFDGACCSYFNATKAAEMGELSIRLCFKEDVRFTSCANA
jgi:hypothetical protein